MALSEDALKRHVGRYRSDDGAVLEFVVEGGQLVARSEGAMLPLMAENPDLLFETE